MKSYRRFYLIGLALLLALLPGMGAAADEGVNYGDQVGYSSETGEVIFIGTDAGRPITVEGAQAGMLPGDQAMAILSAYAPLFGEDNPSGNLEVMSFVEKDGRNYTRYQQTYQGIPVIAGELILTMNDSGQLVSLSGELSPDLNLSIEPSINAREAAQSAAMAIAKYYGGEVSDYTVSDAELWIYDARLLAPSARPQSLVWRMEVTGFGDVPVNAFVLIDAQHGGLSLQFNQIDTSWSAAMSGGSRAEAASGLETVSTVAGTADLATYDADNGTTLPGTLICTEADPSCSAAGTDWDTVAAHIYADNTYDFYYTFHGRDSIDNAGMQLISTTHYDVDYYNAFWNGAQMVYGDAATFAQADDVVAHELTHGVTDYTSNLLYYYQSGAINESLSDLWGEFVDLTNGLGSDDPGDRWWLGEDVIDPVYGPSPVRYMADPTVFADPDKMTSLNYYTGTGDSGGVHYNSGVNNKAIYLMTDGDTFNTYTISPLGITKVAAIYYEAQTNLLTSGSNYLALYYALTQACNNLIGGAEGITPGNCIEVEEALLAVEMDQEPYAGFNPQAEVCPTGYDPVFIFDDDFESGTGNFASSTVYWEYNDTFDDSDSPQYPVIWEDYYGYATSGVYDYWGFNTNTADVLRAKLASDVVLPATTDALYLRFEHSFDFEYYDGGYNYDAGVLQYSVNGGTWMDIDPLLVDGRGYNGTIYDWGSNPLGAVDAFVGTSHGYVSSRYDLSAFAGDSINFRWRVGTDSYVSASGWDIDDVQVYSCVLAEPPATPTGVTASDGTYNNRVVVTWDAMDGATYYEVYRDTSSGGGSMILLDSPVVNTYEDFAVSDLTPYYYWVYACNSYGCSAISTYDSGYMDAAASPFIFTDGFESGDFSAWSSVNDGGGWLVPCQFGAINGSWAACVSSGDNDKRKQLTDLTPVYQTSFSARISFDVNGLEMGQGERFRFLQVKMDQERPFFIVLKFLDGQYWIQMNTKLDDLSKVKTDWILLTDAPHTIEVDWAVATSDGANDGYAELYVDGFLAEALTGLDNDTLYIDKFKVGFTSKLTGKDITGTFYIDDAATSNNGYIGLP